MRSIDSFRFTLLSFLTLASACSPFADCPPAEWGPYVALESIPSEADFTCPAPEEVLKEATADSSTAKNVRFHEFVRSEIRELPRTYCWYRPSVSAACLEASHSTRESLFDAGAYSGNSDFRVVCEDDRVAVALVFEDDVAAAPIADPHDCPTRFTPEELWAHIGEAIPEFANHPADFTFELEATDYFPPIVDCIYSTSGRSLSQYECSCTGWDCL